MANEFIIKINKDSKGQAVSLNSIPADAADALKIFIESLSNFAKLHSNSDVKLSLKDGCIESALVYEGTEIEKEIQDVIDGISENGEYVKLLKDIQDKIKENGLDYSIIQSINGQRNEITTSFTKTRFKQKKAAKVEWSESIKFIDGVLYEVGGKTNVNVHITTEKDPELVVDCTPDEAKILSKFFLKKVYLCVVKKTQADKIKYSFVDRYLKEEVYNELKTFYETTQNNNDLGRYDDVHNLIVELVENENLGQLIKIMRLYNLKGSDRGILRTILMTLKPVYLGFNNIKLNEAYSSLATTLRAGSTNNSI